MLENYINWKRDFEVVPMDAKHCLEVSKLHAARFPKAWSDGEFFSLLSQSNVYGFVVQQTSGLFSQGMAGFVLAREGGGEAEILTVAVNEKIGRAGLGWRLMQSVLRETDLRGADVMFLEVDAANLPAIGLYRKLGFVTVAERKAYYTSEDGTKSTALVMRLDLR
jgi:ribosomal-protein-alanine N-acetyltransferase